MRLSRKHAVLLAVIAGWNVVTYSMFTLNLASAYRGGEDRPGGYWVAHSVLIVVNLLVAAVLARLAWRAWRDAHDDFPPARPSLRR